ncbi:MAG TPA: 2-dehydropantoate 2-reductase [Candidatus Elarobacter sp.]|nr:2-dehydropantoate 2-reductase [Candidatus Elarobacter sp.]
MKIGIVGAGAIGLTLAAALAGKHDVVVLARRAALAELLARDGIEIAGDTGTHRVAVRATADPHALADRDAVIVAVKAYATPDALAPLRGVLAPHALVASVQNGIDYVAAARAALPDARIVAGSTMQGAIALGEGRVRPINRGTTTFARDDSASPTSDDLVAAFAAAGLDARVSDDVDTVLWRKLVVNAAINPLGALASATNGEIVSDPDLAALARALAAEAAAVAAAEGIALADPWALVEAAARSATANRNSMLQDLDAGRPTEIDAISGTLVRRAAAHRIAVPRTETMLRLVRARERLARAARGGAQS